MAKVGAEYDLSYDVFNQLWFVEDDTATNQQFVMYGYSPGGLRVQKRFYHWVDTCEVEPDPDPETRGMSAPKPIPPKKNVPVE